MTRLRPLPLPLEELPFVLRTDRLEPPLDWRSVFGRTAPVELEIGSGKGLYLVEAARARPEADLLGIERAGKWFHRAAARVSRAGLPNIRMVRADAFDFLSRWTAPASVSTVHVYFPDPWPKKRHAKRRLLQPALFELIARVLPPGGELRLASDVGPYFAGAVDEILAAGPFRRVAWPESPEEGLPTNYAVKYRREGRELHCARFERTAAPGREASGGDVTARQARQAGTAGQAGMAGGGDAVLGWPAGERPKEHQ